MQVADAQREMRAAYLGGFAGALVSGVLWAIAAAVGASGEFTRAKLVLCLGGMLIFPASLGFLRLIGHRLTTSRENPLPGLAMQIAFTIPLTIPVALAASAVHPNWFFPAIMLIVGAHYLPFIFLYGMWIYGVLAALMIAGGLLFAQLPGASFALSGYANAALEIAFAWVLLAAARRGDDSAPRVSAAP